MCKLISLATSCIQGEDTDLRKGGCSLAQSVSQCRIMLFSPQPFWRGGISRTACSHIISGNFQPLLISPFWVTTLHPLPHLPLEHEDLSFQAAKSFSLPLSWAPSVKKYMLHVLPSLQMFVTLQPNPSPLIPGETCYPYVKYRGLSYRDVWVAFKTCASKMFLNQIFSSYRKGRNYTTLHSIKQ